jgi:mycoredoxin
MMTNRRRNLLILLFVIGVPLLINQWWKILLLLDPIDTHALDKNSVVLYSTSWCPYCEKTRQFLSQANIPFTEKDIEKSPQAAAEHRALGGVGIPLTKINRRVVDGFDPQAIRAAIETQENTAPNNLDSKNPSLENKSPTLPAPSNTSTPTAMPLGLPLTP